MSEIATEELEQELNLLKDLDCTPDKRYVWFVKHNLEILENKTSCVRKLMEKVSEGVNILHQYISPDHIEAELVEGSLIKGTCYIKANSDRLGKIQKRNGMHYSSDIDLLVLQSKNSGLDGKDFERKIFDINSEIAESNGFRVIYDFTGIRSGVYDTEIDFYNYIICKSAEDTKYNKKRLEESLQIGCVISGKQPNLFNGKDKYIIVSVIRTRILDNEFPVEISNVNKISPLPRIALKSFGTYNPKKTCI
jgi:hypothetical protein